jgi:hypothetical protein
MNAGTRPGGLTALAIINFVFGGFRFLSVLGLFGLIVLFSRNAPPAGGNMPPAQAERMEALREAGAGLFFTLGALSVVTAVLLIVSGIGYLKLRKGLGRMVGNAYGVVGIFSTLATMFWLPAVLGGGRFGIGTIIGLIYPVLTLVLINTAFKDDFVN